MDLPVPVSHVRFNSTVFFAFDKYSLEPQAEKTLSQFALAVLKDKFLRSVLVVGHTDSTGPDDYNTKLSLNRAATVAKKLRAAGLKDELIGVVPMGEAKPFATNATEEGRALNRRVEFFISEVPGATIKIIEMMPFNPCFRNDHETTTLAIQGDCDMSATRIPVYGPAGEGRTRGTVELGRNTMAPHPTVRPVLPESPRERPSLKDLIEPN